LILKNEYDIINLREKTTLLIGEIMKKHKWNEENMPDLSGKTIVVTGANSGLGFESVKMYAKKNAQVIMACRSLERGQVALEEVKKDSPNAKLVVMALDLGSMESIKEFVVKFKKEYDMLDILLNNAGIMTTPYGVTVDGIEQQQGVNHFGHFALTALLFDTIKNTENSRIVNISSLAHKFGKMNFDNLLFEKGKGYSPSFAYARSKLENLLFTYELQRRVDKAELDIKILVGHPGISHTNLGRHIKRGFQNKVFESFMKIYSHDAYYGAMAGVRASVDFEALKGTYYGPRGLFGGKGLPVVVKSSKRSHNIEDAVKLWDLSEELTGVTFTV
jgi:NAD(P)-dependent dehydrogenase (short-subunit alcohol dehydrogenase family)